MWVSTSGAGRSTSPPRREMGSSSALRSTAPKWVPGGVKGWAATVSPELARMTLRWIAFMPTLPGCMLGSSSARKTLCKGWMKVRG